MTGLRTDLESLWLKVDRAAVGPGSCWRFKASTDSHGYGQIVLAGRLRRAHRVAWILYNGRIPDGLVIDHTCRNKLCCNPSHLEAVTVQENNRRAAPYVRRPRRDQTHCLRGHALTGTNVMTYRGRRHCRKCKRDLQRARRAAARKGA